MLRSLARLAAVACALLAPLAEGALGQGMPSRTLELSAPAVAPGAFRAPRLAARPLVALPAPAEKKSPAMDASGRLRIGSERALEKEAAVTEWVRVEGGWVARFQVTSEGAESLRVRIDLGPVPGAMELRAQGIDARVEAMLLDPTLGASAWTPWTDGPTQTIEVFSSVRPSNEALGVGAVMHFDTPIETKAAGPCTIATSCPTGDASLDTAIGERTKSEVKLQFNSAGLGFLCSGTLINSEKFPAPFVLTANHCISDSDTAATVVSIFFFEATACGSNLNTTPTQIGGGAALVYSNFNVDSTLLQMNFSPPAGATYAGWNPARLTAGDAVVSISHPEGDSGRYAIGTVFQEERFNDWPQDMYEISFSKGIIQGGSSGSGLFTRNGASLDLRAILTGTTTNNGSGMSCSNLAELAIYSRFEIFEPEIDQFLRTAARPTDDQPNFVADYQAIALDPNGADKPLDQRGGATVAFDNRRIDYAGDIDLYRFTLFTSSAVSVWTEGSMDTVGNILDFRGVKVAANDDIQTSSNNMGITQVLSPGTYYAMVAPWDAAVTGPYNFRMRADNVDANYTDLWWNQAESGWGINVNHQGNTLFATLFTYDTDGTQMWLAMSNGAKQSDGSYSGDLYRLTGPAFNAVPFGAVSLSTVGTMKLVFNITGSVGQLDYTVNGTAVHKVITRQVFSTQSTCGWSIFDRTWSFNYQDLWWNPAEPGWGVNIAHQGDTLFATLFTYDAGGKGAWMVMSAGALTGNNRYSGTLYRTTGPAFNAIPWTPINLSAVGTMTFTFSDGNTGTLTYSVNGTQVTKPIQRQVFGTIKTQCE